MTIIIIIIMPPQSLRWTLATFLVSWPYTQSVGLVRQGNSPSQGLYTHSGQHTKNKHLQISMPRVRFEPMTPAFQQEKTVHSLDCAATDRPKMNLVQEIVLVFFLSKLRKWICGAENPRTIELKLASVPTFPSTTISHLTLQCWGLSIYFSAFKHIS
jgi:hypothetical protein